MIKLMQNVLVFLSATSLLACGTGSIRTSKGGFALRPFQEETLPNGLRVIWLTDQSLPRISYNLMVQVGSLNESKGQEGITSMTTAMLDQGTVKRKAPQIAEDLAQIGADFSYVTGYDQTVVNASGLSATKEDVLKIFSEIILTPAFQNNEIERRRSVIIASMQKNKDQPSYIADETLDTQVFGAHPYAHPIIGTTASVRNLKRKDLLRHYFAYFRPNNSILTVVGQYDESFKAHVRKAFEAWTSAELRPLNIAKADLKPREVFLVSKAGLQQTQIRWGHVGINRKDPDFMALRLANVILGGAFASRLNQKIRDDLGLTYSISSGSEARLEPGSFEVSTFTRHDKAVTTVLETEKLLKEFVDKGIKEEELQAAKALLIGQFPAALETADRTASNLMVLRRYGISDDYLRFFQQNVQDVTLQEVNAAIRKHLHPDKLQLVIYSDEKALAVDLPKLGLVRKKSL
ncbi:MAG: M16 family metallopeptidase [Bdellovibrio sp.]|jgi:zinc protease